MVKGDDDEQLPPPATSFRAGSVTKKATFDNGVRVHWARFKRKMGNGSAPSESLMEGETMTDSSNRRWGNGTLHQLPIGSTAPDDDADVDEIVVDNNFVMDGGKSVTQGSEPGISLEKSAGSATHGTHATDRDSFTQDTEGFLDRSAFLSAIRYRFWPILYQFFLIKFYDPTVEAHYQKEAYYQTKSLRMWGGVFIILNWVLVCILIPRESMITADRVFYYGICPVFCIPLPILVIYDWPRARPLIWQLFMTVSIWSWATYLLILVQVCGTYNAKEAVVNCRGKEFTGIFYYTSAFPVIALFALGQSRLFGAIGGTFCAGLIGCTIRNKNTWIRSLLNFVIYMSFLLWIHYKRETSERRLYTLRDQLKVQYRATQKAQVSESKAADSKKRFSSYIFHEVRVPLNTALLAVQNMEASGIFNKEHIEFTALEGSLNMMSKVLNDVLDFNRMDSGRFESVSKPYAFHKVIKGILVPLRLAANARELELVTELDPRIDLAARRAFYTARGDPPAWIESQLANHEDGADMDNGDGFIVGDEHRLRQIVTNLASNACKFTPTGGKIFVRTKLIYPPPDAPVESSSTDNDGSTKVPDNRDSTSPGELSSAKLSLHNSGTRGIPNTIIIRMEVEDTGVGIRRKDMVDNRLFSPYVQTDIGRFQGGKGTGLGLALSKHIVRLSGGRLGVKSKLGVGSSFWVELAVGVGPKVLEKSDFDYKEDIVATSLALARTTREAFHPADGEGETPSSMMTSITANYEALDSSMPQQSHAAMRGLMEHSGQIELLPRMNHRMGESSILTDQAVNGSLNALQPEEPPTPSPVASSSTPPSPTSSKRSNALGVRPPRLPLPPNPTSFNSASTSSTLTGPSFPYMPSSYPSAPALPETKPAFPLSVLVVDDDYLTRKLMSRMLTRLGCTVETAENGQIALDLLVPSDDDFDPRPQQVLQTTSTSKGGILRSTLTAPSYRSPLQPRYDIIFLDNQMPQMSGVELVKQVRRLNLKDFIVGVTGNALKEDQVEYTDAGVDHVLTKPVMERSIRQMLQLASERRKLQEGEEKG